MDRSDEKREDHDRDTPVNPTGGPLGIGDANPPRDHVPSSGTRKRTLDEEGIDSGSREVQRTPGATGIDMGSGGTGTDVERD